MSLKVWLPLTGTLENNGCSNITVTNYSASVDNNGKVGKCYSFNGNDYYISLAGKQLFDCFKGGAQQFTVSMWAYHADTRRAILFGDWSLSNSIGFNIELSTGHGLRFYWNGDPDYVPSGMNIGASTWHHICLTYDGSSLKSYLDGVLKDNRSGTLAAKSKTAGEFRLGRDARTTDTALNGKLNDFRVYDHALSAAEVNELAQALVCHYKLDDCGTKYMLDKNVMPNSHSMYLGTANPSTGTWRLAGSNTMDRQRVFVEDNIYCFQNSGTQTDNDGSCYGIDAFPLDGNSLYYISMKARKTSGTGDAFAGFHIYSVSGYIDGSYTKTDKGYYVTPLTNEWSKCWIVIRTDSNNTRNIYIGVTTGETDVTTQMCCVEIRKVLDTRTSTTITDSSGFGYNGTINTSQTSNASTPRYDSSAKFNGTDNSILTPFNTMIHDLNYTVSVWTYKTSIGSKGYQTILGGPSGFELEARNSSAETPVYVGWNWGKPTAAYEFNKWNMFTFVHTSTDCKIYVNGEYVSTGSSVAIPTGNYYVGAWNTATQQNFEGLMSDFRIYATALSAEDIKELYLVESKVDNRSEIHSYSFEEKGGRELIAGALWTNAYSVHSLTPWPSVTNGEYVLTGGSSISTPYIPISPSGHTYMYDIEVSVDSGNVFYIGFERYDKDKTARSNAACVYLPGLSGSSEARTHKRYFGTVDLSTDGVNPCAFITLRILNDWSGANNRKATIHKLSLREVSTIQVPKVSNAGVFEVDELNENAKAAFFKNGFVEATEFIEM